MKYEVYPKIVELTKGFAPIYGSAGASGADIKADLTNCDKAELIGDTKYLYIEPMERLVVPAGFKVQLTPNTEMQIRPRSGMSLKHGLVVLNAPGTIDEDYRGEVGVILINLSEERYRIKHGERIAQAVVAPYLKANWVLTDKLDETVRGEGGFGHTGKQELKTAQPKKVIKGRVPIAPGKFN